MFLRHLHLPRWVMLSLSSLQSLHLSELAEGLCGFVKPSSVQCIGSAGINMSLCSAVSARSRCGRVFPANGRSAAQTSAAACILKKTSQKLFAGKAWDVQKLESGTRKLDVGGRPKVGVRHNEVGRGCVHTASAAPTSTTTQTAPATAAWLIPRVWRRTRVGSVSRMLTQMQSTHPVT